MATKKQIKKSRVIVRAQDQIKLEKTVKKMFVGWKKSYKKAYGHYPNINSAEYTAKTVRW